MFFHANLSQSAHDFDIAIDKPVHNQPSGNMVLDSVFLHMDTATLAAFAAKGVTVDSIIISKAERDQTPCTFDRLIPSDWVNLN